MHFSKRRAEGDASQIPIVIGVIAIFGLVLFAAIGTGWLNLGAATVSTGQGNQGDSSCPGVTPSSSNFVQTSISGFGGDSLSSPAVNYFATTQSGQLQQIPSDNPGSASFPVTSVNQYALDKWVAQFTASGAYPVWSTVSGDQLLPPTGTGSPVTMAGIPVFEIKCAPSLNAGGSHTWQLIGTLVNAPGSGTSSTSNVAVSVVSSTGASLSSATTSLPTVQTRWDAFVQVKQANKGIESNFPIYGSSLGSVTDFATGLTSYSQPLNVGAYALVLLNQSGVHVALDQAASSLIPGATIQQIEGLGVSAGTAAYLIGPLPGCAPSAAASTTNPLTCEDVPFDIYETVAATGHHAGVDVQFIDNQQAAFIENNLVTPAQTGAGWHTSSSSGVMTGLGGVQTTAVGGLPAPYVEQFWNAVLGY